MAPSKATPQLPARFIRPEPCRVIARERLFRRLDEGRHGKITWICSPGGSGKTVLACSYIGARELDAVWYQLDQREADPSSLLHHLAMVAASRAPGQPPLPALTPAYLASMGTYSRNFFERFYTCIERPGLIVLDNYQDVPADSPVHEIVRDAADLLPDGLSLLVLSREPPPRCYARFQTHRVLIGLDWQAMRFETDEAHALAGVHGVAEAQRDWIDHCQRLTGGWAAGLALLLHSGQDTSPNVEPAASTKEVLFDYFASEIFAPLPENVRSLLIKAAPFPKLFPAVLAMLDEEAETLFREFILARAASLHGEQGWRMLVQRAAEILVTLGQHEDAVPFLIESADWEGLAKPIKIRAPGMLMLGLNHKCWPWPLRIYTLGRFAIALNDQPLPQCRESSAQTHRTTDGHHRSWRT